MRFFGIVAAFIVIDTVPIMTMNNELFRRIQNRQLFNVLVENSISIFIHEISRYNKMISILEASHRLVPHLYHLKSLIIEPVRAISNKCGILTCVDSDEPL